MGKTIRDEIMELADEEYRKFTSALLPNINNILGVRLPQLRKIARQIAIKDYHNFIIGAECKYFEETMLKGMVIGYIKSDLDNLLFYVSDFVPKIDNWSICDSFCSGLKFTRSNKELVWEFIQQYFYADKEYFVRFSVVMVINYFVEADYINMVLDILNRINHDGYYVKMAVAWAVSICYIKFPIETERFLKNNYLDDFTYNKSLQKIIESNRIDVETKTKIRSMKRRSS